MVGGPHVPRRLLRLEGKIVGDINLPTLLMNYPSLVHRIVASLVERRAINKISDVCSIG